MIAHPDVTTARTLCNVTHPNYTDSFKLVSFNEFSIRIIVLYDLHPV